MPQKLDYAYDEETVEELHHRALRIFARLQDVHDIPPMVEPNVYNSVLNMAANVKVSPLAVAQPLMDTPRGN